MSITDELRFYVCRLRDEGSIGRACEKNLLNIADRIDAEHERCCKALDEAWSATAHQVHESAMGELSDGWVELPKDADGVPWRIGDKFESGTVDYLSLTERGWVIEGDNGSLYSPEEMRHKQPDTWECILEDAIRGDGGNYGCLEERLKATVPSLVARCKALAGEEER